MLMCPPDLSGGQNFVTLVGYWMHAIKLVLRSMCCIHQALPVMKSRSEHTVATFLNVWVILFYFYYTNVKFAVSMQRPYF